MTRDLTRREALELGAAALAATALPDVLFAAPPGTTPGVGYFARFGVTEAMIKDALAVALSRGADYADLYFEHSVSNSLGLEDGEVNRGYRQVQLGVGVRVVKGDQTGYGFTEDLTLEALKATARTAATIADGPGRAGPARFHFAKDLPNRYPVKTRWEDVKTEQRLPILTSLNARAFALDGRVKKVNLGFMDQGSAVLIADSNGRLVEDIRPMTSLYVSCVAEQDGRKETNGYNVAGRADLGYYTPDRLERAVKEAVARTTILFEAVQPPAGEMPVVLAAGSSGILLHGAIGHGMEADCNRKGTSIDSDKIAKPIAKPFVNIVDEGTQTAARGALNVDDEGMPAGRT